MAAGDLTTVAAVSTWLNLASPADNALIQTLISAVSAFVPRVLCQGVLSAQYVEIRKGNGKSQMQLRQWPVQSIQLVEWQGIALSTQTDLLSGVSGIANDDRSVMLVNYCFPQGDLVRITYTAGWASVPLDIQEAVTELVGEEYTRRTHIGESSHSQGGQTTVSFDQKAMHAAITAMLYTHIRVAPL